LKLSSVGGDSGSMECRRGYGGTYGGTWRNLRLAGIWSEATDFVFDVKIFSHFFLLEKELYKFRTFNAICKYNAAVNCFIQHKKMFISVNVDRSYCASKYIIYLSSGL
jgi:hypothetical protein